MLCTLHDMSEIIDIKSIRERFGLTQVQLADFLGLDRSSVSRMEGGQPLKGPTKILLEKLVAGEIPAPTSRIENEIG